MLYLGAMILLSAIAWIAYGNILMGLTDLVAVYWLCYLHKDHELRAVHNRAYGVRYYENMSRRELALNRQIQQDSSIRLQQLLKKRWPYFTTLRLGFLVVTYLIWVAIMWMTMPEGLK
jgi:hypothetical protein